MSLSIQEITRLKNRHASELSALNAIVKLIGENPQLETDLDLIKQILEDNIGQSNLPGFLRSSTSSNLAQDCYTFAIANVGNSSGIFLGNTLKKGETLNFGDSSLRSFYPSGSFTWDATGTEFIIIYSY